MNDILFVYKIFNFSVTSNIPLPELPLKTHQSKSLCSNIIFNLSDQPLANTEQLCWFHSWYEDEENTEITISVARQNGQYLLRFPDLADFMLDLDNSKIQCNPAPDTPEETLRHLLLDQIIPRFIGQLGNLILHASAIALPDGSCITFLGQSGWGKSTLASSFYQNGAHLLSDDSLLLKVEDGRLIGIPAYAGSRLWQDSADFVFPDCPDLPQVTHYSDKKRLILDKKTDSSKMEIQALFLLNDPSKEIGLNSIKIKAMDGADMIMSMLRQTFLFDAEDMGVVARQFSTASQISEIKPTIYSLSYPRKYEQLAALRTAIVNVVEQTSTAIQC